MTFAASAFADRPFAALPASSLAGINVAGGTLAASAGDCVVGVVQTNAFSRAFAAGPFAMSPTGVAPSGTGISVAGGTLASTASNCELGTVQTSRFSRAFAAAPFALSGADTAAAGTGISVAGGTLASSAGAVSVGIYTEFLAWPPALGDRPLGWVPLADSSVSSFSLTGANCALRNLSGAFAWIAPGTFAVIGGNCSQAHLSGAWLSGSVPAVVHAAITSRRRAVLGNTPRRTPQLS